MLSHTLSIELLCLGLLLLVIVSAFFSGSEIAMMSLNRYRLRHLARQSHRGAKRAQHLLERPDRLLGVILIGNTFANLLASALATRLAVSWFGELGVLITTLVLTLVVLIFAEIVPKTLAALQSERFAFSVSFLLQCLLTLLYPLVWLSTNVANAVLRLFGVNVKTTQTDALSSDELRTILGESKGKISPQYQNMLMRVLDLDRITVTDIMTSRSEIIGIDLNDDIATIVQHMTKAKHTRLVVYYRDIDNIKGMLHVRDAIEFIVANKLTKKHLMRLIQPAYFIPEATPLHIQLVNFEKEQQRSAIVVDEYGELQGLVTIEAILAEIVGEFTSELSTLQAQVHRQTDGSILAAGEVSLREINRLMGWQLPLDGPKTINGLIIETLEEIPTVGVKIHLQGYTVAVLAVKANMVKLARIYAN